MCPCVHKILSSGLAVMGFPSRTPDKELFALIELRLWRCCQRNEYEEIIQIPIKAGLHMKL
jgi:hypothetical protein